eukprot:1508973-Prymnesium_polylepis.1
MTTQAAAPLVSSGVGLPSRVCPQVPGLFCAFIALQDVHYSMGTTVFLPGTHKNGAQRKAFVEGQYDGKRDSMLAKASSRYTALKVRGGRLLSSTPQPSAPRPNPRHKHNPEPGPSPERSLLHEPPSPQPSSSSSSHTCAARRALQAGDAVFFDMRTLHAGTANLAPEEGGGQRLLFILTFRNRKAREALGHAPNLRPVRTRPPATRARARATKSASATHVPGVCACTGQRWGLGCRACTARWPRLGCTGNCSRIGVGAEAGMPEAFCESRAARDWYVRHSFVRRPTVTAVSRWRSCGPSWRSRRRRSLGLRAMATLLATGSRRDGLAAEGGCSGFLLISVAHMVDQIGRVAH